MQLIEQFQRQTVVQSYRQKYRAYIQSPHWKALRWQAITEAGRVCQSCGHNRRLEAHHRIYRNLTDCTVKDLVVLCSRCHEYFHDALKVNGTKASMYELKETIDLIHNYCRMQRIPLVRQVSERPFRKLVQSAYSQCKGRQFSRKALEKLIIDLRAIVATMPEAVAVGYKPLTPFQQQVIRKVRSGAAFVRAHLCPQEQDELDELHEQKKVRQSSPGIFVNP